MFTLNNDYTVLDHLAYTETVTKSRNKVIKLLEQLQLQRHHSLNTQLDWLIQQFVNTPYCYQGAMGEGDWQADSFAYQPGALHVKQDPVYRLDGLDCQTFIQVVLALLNSQSLADFEKNIIKTAYGAVDPYAQEMVRYYNRNNFVEGDWNKVNRLHGFIENAMQENDFSDACESIQITLERQKWFQMQTQNSGLHVRVLADKYGHDMVKRFTQMYQAFAYPHFQAECINIDYLPKEVLANSTGNAYCPNLPMLDSIPTPAIVEFIRDCHKWMIGGKPIKELIGTDIAVSHIGFLYKHTFQKGELMYLKMQCHYDEHQYKRVRIQPVYSQYDHNTQLMLAHATKARPDGYVFYLDREKQYCVSDMAPIDGRPFVLLNRVETIPLYHYLTDYQYGTYWYMNNPSLLGLHFERIL